MLEQNAAPAQPEAESTSAPASAEHGETRRSASEDLARDRAEKIREIAYSFYEARGCIEGSALDDWLRAEACFIDIAGPTAQLPVPA